MHWLVDHAGTVYLLLGIVALSLLAAFWLNRRVKFLGLAAGVLLVMVLFWLLSRAVITDRKQIELNLRAMAAAAVEGKADKLLPYLASDFHYEGVVDRRTAEGWMRRGLERHKPSDIVIWNYEATEVSRERKKAKVGFNVRASGPFGEAMYYFRCDFVLENDVWKVQTFEVFNPINEQKTRLPI